MPAPEVAIRVEGLIRVFREVRAVDGLTFDVRRGELFGLVGPDGAGKTTTLRMLAGVMRPSGGDATLEGISVGKNPEGVKRRIAYMSQRFGLYTDLTVRENLDFYADLYRVPKRERPVRLERLFEFSNLGPFQERLAGNLSGGMRQKLGLSCALIHEPKILLLDEPTFGVDPISRRDLWLIVHEMVGRGTTALVSTAYMDEAERFDRLVLIDQGKSIASGTPAELQAARPGEVVAIRVERVREARRVAAAIPAVRSAATFGDRLHVTLASAERDGPAVTSALREAGFSPSDPVLIERSMEDVFIEEVARAGRER